MLMQIMMRIKCHMSIRGRRCGGDWKKLSTQLSAYELSKITNGQTPKLNKPQQKLDAISLKRGSGLGVRAWGSGQLKSGLT